MKLAFLILACLKLLTAKAQDGRASDTATTYRSCGLDKICVPRYLCNTNNMELNIYGRKLLGLQMNPSRVCKHLEECCHIDNKVRKKANPQKTASLPTNNRYQECGYSNTGGFIHADHNEAPYGEFPWMVAILHKDSNKTKWYECGGSLLTPFIVLTAAHCVNNKVPNKLIARAGDWDIQANSEPFPHQDRTVRKIIIHKLFDNETLFYDVALLKLDGPLMIEQNVQPICLPLIDQKYFDGSRCFVTGWGTNKFGIDGRYQPVLKKVSMPMVNHNVCQKQLRKTRLSEFFELHESFICAGGELGQDACTVDGGSPLVCRFPGSNDRYFQAGIVAWGIGCGEQNIPSTFANLVYLKPWLIENLKKHNADFKYFTA